MQGQCRRRLYVPGLAPADTLLGGARRSCGPLLSVVRYPAAVWIYGGPGNPASRPTPGRSGDDGPSQIRRDEWTGTAWRRCR